MRRLFCTSKSLVLIVAGTVACGGASSRKDAGPEGGGGGSARAGGSSGSAGGASAGVSGSGAGSGGRSSSGGVGGGSVTGGASGGSSGSGGAGAGGTRSGGAAGAGGQAGAPPINGRPDAGGGAGGTGPNRDAGTSLPPPSGSSFINFNFTRDEYTGAGVVGSEGDRWNHKDPNPERGSNVDMPLVDVKGQSTGATLSLRGPGGDWCVSDWGTCTYYLGEQFGAFGDSRYSAMMGQFLLAKDGGPIGLEFAGLPPSSKYIVYAYAATDKEGRSKDRKVEFSSGGEARSLTMTAVAQSTFEEGSSYVRFPAAADTSGKLTITVKGVGGEADVNAVQLQPAP